MFYRYGMKLRRFSPGAQPMEGFVERRDSLTGKYHDVLIYNRFLPSEEAERFDLAYLGIENEEFTVAKVDVETGEESVVGTFPTVMEAAERLEELRSAEQDAYTYRITSLQRDT